MQIDKFVSSSDARVVLSLFFLLLAANAIVASFCRLGVGVVSGVAVLTVIAAVVVALA